jgi:hypothetical protein
MRALQPHPLRPLGHHKAVVVGIHNLKLLDSEKGKEVEDKRLALLHAQQGNLMKNHTLTHGYSFDGWKAIDNVMLLKDSDNPCIHHKCMIYLYEADCNLLLSIKWHNLIHHSLENETLNSSQYGSLSGREFLVPVCIKELQNKIARASHKPYIKQDFDATCCYDHIIPWIATDSTTMYVMSMQEPIQEARYLLKTKLGISDESYFHCQVFPIYGTDQGSGNSSMIWCFISSVLFDIHKEQPTGASYISPDGYNT